MDTFCCQTSLGYVVSLDDLRVRLFDLCALAWQWSVTLENEGRPHETHRFVDIEYSNPQGDEFAWDPIIFRFPLANPTVGFDFAEPLVCLHPSSATAVKLPIYEEENLQKVDPLKDFVMFWATLKEGITCCSNGGIQRYQCSRPADDPSTRGFSGAGACCCRTDKSAGDQS